MDHRPTYYAWDRQTDAVYPVANFQFGSFEDRDQARVDLTTMLVPDAWVETATDEHIWVSTVFLALDHAWEGPPMLFETMIFGVPEDHPLFEYQQRYVTAADAREGHKQAVELVGAAIRYLTTKGGTS